MLYASNTEVDCKKLKIPVIEETNVQALIVARHAREGRLSHYSVLELENCLICLRGNKAFTAEISVMKGEISNRFIHLL